MSAEQSRTLDDNEAKYAAARAIDLDLRTASVSARAVDRTVWLQVKLDSVHCVQGVVEYKGNGDPEYSWTCTSSDCSACVGPGDWCKSYSLTVESKRTSTDGLTAATDCRYGDTVKLEYLSGSEIWAMEVAIFGKRGKLTLGRKNF